MWDHEDFFCYYLDDNFQSNHKEFTTNPIAACNFQQILDAKDFRNDVKEEFTNISSYNLTRLLNFGVTSLLAFIQSNFTGPERKIVEFQPQIEETSLKSLSVDGEEVDPNTKYSTLLVTAKKLLTHAKTLHSKEFSVQLWYLRYLIIHQKVIEEPCISLHEEFLKTAEILLESRTKLTSLKNNVLVTLEILQGYLLYKRITPAEKLFQEVKELLKVEVEKSAALGVRTKYQTKALPQQVVRVNESEENSIENQLEKPSVTHGSSNLPKLLTLDDDLRLEKIKFNDPSEGPDHQHNAVVQSLLLAYLRITELNQAHDDLYQEEIAPVLTSLLNQDHGPWLIRICSLLANVKLESNHKRTVERSLKQSEELVNLIKGDATPVLIRFSYLFTSNLHPIWNAELLLADMMTQLGMVKTALDIFIRLQRWEAVIECYSVLQLRHKAAEIIQQEIEKKPTVKLYCLLGDATDDVSWYETAWNMSNHKSGKAQRHWGNFYFAKKQYEEAIPHLELSLQFNSLQETQWLRLGFAALTLERWELAANAYRRYTMLEANGFESWNNLAKAYIKLNDKPRAHKVLNEALKCNFSNWKVWENFLLVSIDIGSFEDAINAYNRLLELKENKYFDKEILEIIFRAIKEDKPDCNGTGSSRLKNKFATLLGRQLAQNPTLAVVWEISANLTDDALIRGQKFLKAYRAYIGARNDWVRDMELCEKVLNITVQAAESTLEAVEYFEGKDNVSVASQLSSIRLVIQGVVKIAKQENGEKFNQDLELLQGYLTKITEHMLKLNNK